MNIGDQVRLLTNCEDVDHESVIYSKGDWGTVIQIDTDPDVILVEMRDDGIAMAVPHELEKMYPADQAGYEAAIDDMHKARGLVLVPIELLEQLVGHVRDQLAMPDRTADQHVAEAETLIKEAKSTRE